MAVYGIYFTVLFVLPHVFFISSFFSLFFEKDILIHLRGM